MAKLKRKYSPAFSRVFDSYKFNAKRKKIKFKISERIFHELIQKHCFFCGAPPGQLVVRSNSSIVYTGVDRVSSDAGYQKDNLVPCCRLCNAMKSSLKPSDFLAQIARVFKHAIKPK